MDYSKMILGVEKATPEQTDAIKQANEILSNAGLELIGTRPKDR